ncbi:hypothetical protein RJ640_004920 [Escallonia rubra]|uniref:25S rRNA (uridine-N(3))-methyltransferase BMT5-like domain-containing protein n=1 Tax=Escallonia rubra TaxID=112253 RepID=A0AA88RCL1_9ASTE|nr:hypothetical protein RJ640_004920 [Escallonia rubra]
MAKEHRTEEEETEEEKWVSHYSSSHRILLVGEGDFSFSLSLALSFASASNIVATSLDSYECIGILSTASSEMQVACSEPAELAVWNSLFLIECLSFKVEDYPGYNHKRGSGVRCDEPFPLGECSTFKFIFLSAANKMIRAKRNLNLPQCSHQQLQEIPVHVPQHPSTFVLGQQQPDSRVFTHPPIQYPNSLMFDWQPSNSQVFRCPPGDCIMTNGISGFAGSPPPASMSILDEYLKPRGDALGRIAYNGGHSKSRLYTYGENKYDVGYSKFLVDTFGRSDNNVGHMKSLEKLYGRTDDYMSNFVHGALKIIYGPTHDLSIIFTFAACELAPPGRRHMHQGEEAIKVSRARHRAEQIQMADVALAAALSPQGTSLQKVVSEFDGSSCSLKMPAETLGCAALTVVLSEELQIREAALLFQATHLLGLSQVSF